jgi:Zn-dependent peptidase ImmA (M78 family)
MSRFAYYESLKELARQVRAEHGLAGPRVLRSDLRRIYQAHGIRIDLWPHRFKQLRGAYFNDDLGATVVLDRNLPPEPMIFTMGHELKHHLADRGLGLSYCDASNKNDEIEIGAEIFSAELIFPETDFIACLDGLGVARGKCTPELLVRLKHETATTMSYAGLAKRAEYLGFASRAGFARVKWKTLEEQIYGEPVYKQVLRSRGAYAHRQ